MGTRHYILSPAQRAKRCFVCLAVIGSIIAGTAYASLNKGGKGLGEIIATAVAAESKPAVVATTDKPAEKKQELSAMQLTLQQIVPSSQQKVEQ